jgi:hypothetical protein
MTDAAAIQRGSQSIRGWRRLRGLNGYSSQARRAIAQSSISKPSYAAETRNA